jgi:hypothetical protein
MPKPSYFIVDVLHEMTQSSRDEFLPAVARFCHAPHLPPCLRLRRHHQRAVAGAPLFAGDVDGGSSSSSSSSNSDAPSSSGCRVEWDFSQQL